MSQIDVDRSQQTASVDVTVDRNLSFIRPDWAARLPLEAGEPRSIRAFDNYRYERWRWL